MTNMKLAILAAAAGALAACAGGPAVAPPASRAAERDPIETFRLYRKGAEQRDGACALKLLAFADRKESTCSQREYARLFVERLLAGGGLPSNVAAGLHERLAVSWNFLEPRSPSKVRGHLEAMARAGMTEEMAGSTILREMARATGVEVRWTAARREDVRACDATPADGGRMEQRGMPAARPDVRGPGAASLELAATAWGGGNDRLLQASGVLAFVVNESGEPVFRGRHLWVRNGSDRAVTLTVPEAGVSHRELKPGAEEMLALHGPATSGIDLSVRYAWKR